MSNLGGLFSKLMEQHQSIHENDLPTPAGIAQPFEKYPMPHMMPGLVKTAAAKSQPGLPASPAATNECTSADILPENADKPRIEAAVKNASERFGVPENLIKSVICVESNGKCGAVSPVGARGLMQLMPATAKELGCADPHNIEQNVDAGTKYLKQLLDRYDGNKEKALAAYNAGMGNVEKYGGIPPFKETMNYVKKVLMKFTSAVS